MSQSMYLVLADDVLDWSKHVAVLILYKIVVFVAPFVCFFIYNTTHNCVYHFKICTYLSGKLLPAVNLD